MDEMNDWIIFSMILIIAIIATAIFVYWYVSIKNNNRLKTNELNNNDMNRNEHYLSYGDSKYQQWPSHAGNRESRSPASSNYNGVDETRPSTVAIIYRSEFDYISRCILDYPNIETGGQLFGFITESGTPVVCYAIGPGPRSNHQIAYFNQDTDYLQHIYNELNRRSGLRYIGEWHSHHQLGLAKPSGHDASTIVHGVQRSNFRHFLLCIGNCDGRGHSTLNAFTFHLNHGYNYFHAPWKIIEIESPYRPILDNGLHGELIHPQTRRACHGDNFIIDNTGRQLMTTPDYNDEYWLNSKANNLILKSIIDFLTHNGGKTNIVKPQLDANKHVHIFVKHQQDTVHIAFTERFPDDAPKITINDQSTGTNTRWMFSGNIYDAFVKYYCACMNEYANETTIESQTNYEPVINKQQFDNQNINEPIAEETSSKKEESDTSLINETQKDEPDTSLIDESPNGESDTSLPDDTLNEINNTTII